MKKTSKFLSMILALAMAFALAVPAFAEDDGDYWAMEDGYLVFSVEGIGYLSQSCKVGRASYSISVDYDGFTFSGVPREFIVEQGTTLTVAYSYVGGVVNFVKLNQGSDGVYVKGDTKLQVKEGEGVVIGPEHAGLWFSGPDDSGNVLIMNVAALAETEQPAVSKPAPGVSVPLNDGSGEFLYTVRSGDSLIRIAAYYYGDANVYKLIYERNKDTLSNANTIYAGQTIILPSYSAVAQFKAAAK